MLVDIRLAKIMCSPIAGMIGGFIATYLWLGIYWGIVGGFFGLACIKFFSPYKRG